MRRSAIFILFVLSALPAVAGAPDQSHRPTERPVAVLQLALTLTPQQSLRPVARPDILGAAVIPVALNPVGFERWVDTFQGRALRAGISHQTLQATLGRVSYLPDVIERDRNQSEFTKTLWDYLDTAVSDTRIRNGRAALQEHAQVLTQIERVYGVPKEIVVAVWGLESAYGSFRGSTNTLSALATLAYDGRRGAFFEAELINALKIIDAGDTSPRNMQGSWAGAMGHTQFMPSSFLQYAVDFTGDGRRDIWGNNPSDALASTANYLRRHGWQPGAPWGMEVRLPQGFDYSQTGERTRKSAAEWTRAGVRTLSGYAVPDHGPASILAPAGAGRTAFVIYQNFQVIERYNPADAYVIAVGHLADRIAGGPEIQGSWPRGDRALARDERRELQRRLRDAGFNPGIIDGKIGPRTLEAVRAYQRASGAVVDGYVSLALLEKLRR